MDEKKQQRPDDNIHSGHRRRLRETYTERGCESMHDHQLLELLLFYALPRRDTNEIAHRLLRHFGSLEAVFSADVEELQKVEGIGEKRFDAIKDYITTGG